MIENFYIIFGIASLFICIPTYYICNCKNNPIPNNIDI